MKKLILAIILALTTFTFVITPALAVDPPTPAQTGSENIIYTAEGYAKGLDAGLKGNFSNIIGSASNESARLWFMTMALGSAPKAFYANAELQANLPLLRSGALSYVGGTIATIYEYKPASTGQYIAYYQNKMGFPSKSAYAQGIGFNGLSPLLPLWTVFRNIAYGFLIIVMVVVGFMVLFRMKIDPRTVITIQDAIPRIIISLILITFSYVIVGLMIDLMYLLIFAFILAMKSALGTIQVGETTQFYTGGSTWELLSATFTTGTSAVDEISNILFGWLPGGNTGVGSIVGGVVAAVVGGVLSAGNPLVILGGLGYAATAGAGLALGINGNPLVLVLIGLALLFAFVRILITLISAYAQIVINLIFGPLQLMFGAIPNVDAFGSWFRDLISNLAVFPITMGLLLVAQVVARMAETNSNFWRPPGLAGSLGQSVGSGVSGIIALGIVFMIPNISGSIRELLKAKPFIPGGLGAITGPVTSPLGTVWTFGYQAAMLKSYLPKGQSKAEVETGAPSVLGGAGGGERK